MSKYAAFVEALKKLCAEHDVDLYTSGFDRLQVWDHEAVPGCELDGRIDDYTHQGMTAGIEVVELVANH